ncbi:hypothetical protein SRABI128_03148 [Microbacterium sp. Bi128]|nr:hypothetical protein SRABI128_03148 [Microbacterium sp. Bi128]
MSGVPAGPGDRAPAEDEAAADAGGHDDRHRVVAADEGTAPVLRQGDARAVEGERERSVDETAEHLVDREPRRLREVQRRDRPARQIDRPGAADPDRPDAHLRDGGEGFLRGGADVRRDRRTVVPAAGLASGDTRTQHGAVGRDDGGIHLRAADVDGQHGSG